MILGTIFRRDSDKKSVKFRERDPRFNVRRKYYPDGVGGWTLAEEMYFEEKVFNPAQGELVKKANEVLPTFNSRVDLSRVLPDSTENQQVFLVLREMGYERFDYVLPADLAEARRKAALFAPLIDAEHERESVSREERSDDNARRARRRAIGKVYDYFNSNPDLNMFVTLTLSPQEVDRGNYAEVYKRLSTWLENRVRRNGMKYLLIPEYHADGENIHFHGTFNESALELKKSGVKRRGKVVYNIADFPLGFTTAIRISGEDATVKVARYMLKYITKSFDSGEKIGGRYYLHGGKLALPRFEYANEPFPMDDPEHTFYPASGVCCCVKKFI